MSTWRGRKGRVTVNSSSTEKLVAELADFEIKVSVDVIDTSVFGDEWTKNDVGKKKWTATVTGFYDPSDTSGQDVLRAALDNGTLLQDMRFYYLYNSTSGQDIKYHAPDTASDANAGCYVTDITSKQMNSSVASISISLTGSGPVTLTETTVP